MSKYFNIDFEYPESQEKEIQNLNSEEKWEQLDSIFNKKNRYINFNQNFFGNDEQKNNKEISNIKNLKQKNENEINLQYLIHPIDDKFDEFIDEKIEILEKLKNNKYQIKEELDNKKQETINFNLLISKYKKEEESIIKEKNKPIKLLNVNLKDNSEEKYEFNKMKKKKYFFNNNNDNSDDLGNKNKMRLKNILNNIKNEKQKNEIISIPNKFKVEKSSIKINNKEENKDYFDTILEDIKKKK